jgi:proteasome alpha subunit
MGGQAEHLGARVGEEWQPGMTLPQVLGLAVRTLGAQAEGETRVIPAGQLEVAVLDRTRPRRAFRRLTGALLEDLLAGT